MAPRKKPAKRALAAMFADRWAIRPESLRQMIQIASRENLSREAIEAELGRPLDNTYTVTVRDGIARIPVAGPLFRYANLFTECSGATSYEEMAREFATALNDSQVKAIVLDIDSPGGEINGCAEMAELVFKARGTKPIVAHISGDGCSAAYWLATAADSVIAGDTAVVGCIGVVACYIDASKHYEMHGIEEIEIVSSQTPNKRPNPAEDAGRAQIQRTIDDLAGVFISAIAKHRGVGADVVQSDFGQGDVFVGAAAAAAGLIDGVATYEELHASLLESPASGSSSHPTAPTSSRKPLMKNQSLKATAANAPDPADDEQDPTKKKPADPDAPTSAEDPDEDKDKDPKDPDEEPNEEDAADDPEEPEKDDEDEEEEEEQPRTKAAARRERARILGIQSLARPGQEKLAAEAIEQGISVNAAARRFLEAERGVGANRLQSLKSDEQHLDKPGPVAPAVVDQASSEATAQSILAVHRTVSTPRRRR
ncbi:MAG: S49 family peptidase [Gemmatimonadaceae bacterium]